MPYLCLFRQYRPRRFDEVHGQEPITRTLQNALRLGRTAQGYLFCGPRGVGKTTVARILAKALNCADGPTPTPCETCESCTRINAGHSLSVIEIDAASHRSIDDIRSLREDVQFAPTDGRTKVYILDEAHQITGPAFEAFLKTLEEPPPHVVFVLATTEPHKIPATILSRVQRLDFRRLAVEAILERLREVRAAEQLDVDEPALHAIARAGDGSLRDALSILDQMLAFGGNQVTAADVDAVLGTLDAETRFALADRLADDDLSGALDWLERLLDEGRDARQLVGEVLAHFRLLLLARLGCAPEQLAALPADLRERLEAQAERFSAERLTAVIEAWAAADKALRWHPQPRILLEVTVIGLLQAPPAPAAAPREPEPRPRALPAPAEPAPVETPPLAGDSPLTVEAVTDRREAFMARLREGWPSLAAHLVHGRITRVEGEMLVYGFDGWDASLNLCQLPERRRVIEQVWGELLGRRIEFRGELLDASPVAVAGPSLDDAVALALDVFPGSRPVESEGAET